MVRKGEIIRNTLETKIHLQLTMDGKGEFIGSSGVGFFDHMLTLLAKHSDSTLQIEAEGDLVVDAHHLVEDIGISLGRAIKEALGDKVGIDRYGFSYVPMDEALIRVVVDISGRPYLAYRVEGVKDRVGEFDTELVEEFLRALANHGGLTIHVDKLAGSNSHHIIEGIFKALARSLRKAWGMTTGNEGVLSTKGVLE